MTPPMSPRSSARWVTGRRYASMLRLVRRFPLALMADESLSSPECVFALARVQGADVFAVKIEQCGGPFNALRVAAIAGAVGIGVYGGTMLEGDAGRVASAHAFASFADLQWGTQLFGPLLLTDESLAKPLDYPDFTLIVLDGPGRGIALDEERVAFFAREWAYAQALQASGKWRHICRLAGAYANVSIFDLQDDAELHEILSGLPLFPFMTVSVASMLRHPSSIRPDDS